MTTDPHIPLYLLLFNSPAGFTLTLTFIHLPANTATTPRRQQMRKGSKKRKYGLKKGWSQQQQIKSQE